MGRRRYSPPAAARSRARRACVRRTTHKSSRDGRSAQQQPEAHTSHHTKPRAAMAVAEARAHEHRRAHRRPPHTHAPKHRVWPPGHLHACIASAALRCATQLVLLGCTFYTPLPHRRPPLTTSTSTVHRPHHLSAHHLISRTLAYTQRYLRRGAFPQHVLCLHAVLHSATKRPRVCPCARAACQHPRMRAL